MENKFKKKLDIYPEKIGKLIVADISPRYYAPHHDSTIAAIKAVDLDSIKSFFDFPMGLKKL